MNTPTSLAAGRSYISFCKNLIVLIATITMIAGSINAEVVQSGYFRGTDFESFGSARFSLLSEEPALVLIFATDAKTADLTRKFDAWYQGSTRPAINIFSIAVAPADISTEVSREAVDQRSLNYPVFLAKTDLLLGEDYKLILINNGTVVQSFTTLDFPSIEKAAKQLASAPADLTAPASPATPIPAATPQITEKTATPAITVAPIATAPTPTISIHVSDTTESTPLGVAETVTTSIISPSTAAVEGNGTYTNTRYQMSVEFPPDWTYQEARSGDGAVGIAPPMAHLKLRIWALPVSDGAEPFRYIAQSLEALGVKYNSHVSVEKRFVVRDGDLQGADETYAYVRPPSDNVPGAPPVPWIGRMQVFVIGSTVKAAAAEAPAPEFNAARPLIDSCFESFNPTNSPDDDQEDSNVPVVIPGM